MIVWAPKKKDIEQYCSKEMAFAVTKDQERVLIGGRQQILSRLAGEEDACVDYDVVQPFGAFLLSDGYAADLAWEEAVSLLEEAQRIFLSPKLKQHVFSAGRSMCPTLFPAIVYAELSTLYCVKYALCFPAV